MCSISYKPIKGCSERLFSCYSNFEFQPVSLFSFFFLTADQLERVFLRLGHAETDEQLQNIISKFLPPVLLKLSSTQEGVRKKVRVQFTVMVCCPDQREGNAPRCIMIYYTWMFSASVIENGFTTTVRA